MGTFSLSGREKVVDRKNRSHTCQNEQTVTLSIMNKLNPETFKHSLPIISFVKASS